MLVYLAIFLVLVSYLKFKWNRRRLYRLLSKIEQPSGHFLIGHPLKFIGSPTYIFRMLCKLFYEHGPNFVLWFGFLPIIFIGKPKDLETVMQSQNCVTKNFPYEFAKDLVGEGVFSAPVHKWRKTRRLIQPTFNSKILENFVDVFVSTGKVCVEEILPNVVGKKGVNWYRIMSNLTLDSISNTAMGIDIDAQREEQTFSRYLETAMKGVYSRFINVFYYPNFIFKLTSTHKELKEACDNLHRFADEVISQKRTTFQKTMKENETSFGNDTKRRAFLDLLLDIDHFSNKDLRDEVTTFFVGGTDTTSVTIGFFLTMMGMHQDIQQQVYEEVKEVLGENYPKMEDLTKFTLLERCIKETLRLFAPTPFISRGVGPEEVNLSDFTLPVGSWIILAIFYVQRSEKYWKNPLKFDPDRFLPEEMAKRHPYTFLPFSGGLRGCLGMRYSYINLKIILSMIMRKYRVFSEYKTIEEIELDEYFVLRPIDGFKFHIEAR